MLHINLILADTARDFITGCLARTRHRFTFDPETLAPNVEDTGTPYDPTIIPTVGFFLSKPAGADYGVQSMREALQVALMSVASENSNNPTKRVTKFLTDLERRPFEKYLASGEAGDLKKRTAKLRHQLDRQGYRLEKSRTRDPLGENYQVYDVIRRSSGKIIMGVPRSLSGIESWLDEGETV